MFGVNTHFVRCFDLNPQQRQSRAFNFSQPRIESTDSVAFRGSYSVQKVCKGKLFDVEGKFCLNKINSKI